MITKFYRFINEGINDYLQPKSEKEIRSMLSNLSMAKRISYIMDGQIRGVSPFDDMLPRDLGIVKDKFIKKIKSVTNNELTHVYIPLRGRSAITMISNKQYSMTPGYIGGGTNTYSYLDMDIYEAAKILSYFEDRYPKLVESINDYLQPKSDDRIEDELEKIDMDKRNDYIFKYNLPTRYIVGWPKSIAEIEDLRNWIKSDIRDNHNGVVLAHNLRYDYKLSEDENFIRKIYCFKTNRVEAQVLYNNAIKGVVKDYAIDYEDLNLRTLKKLEADLIRLKKPKYPWFNANNY